MDEWMDGSVDGQTHRQTDACMHGSNELMHEGRRQQMEITNEKGNKQVHA